MCCAARVDQRAVLEALDDQLRNRVNHGLNGETIERAGAVIRCLGPADGWSGIVWSEVDESTADAVIADQLAYFAVHDRPFEWKFYSHDRPADLAERLHAAGLVAEPAEAVLVAETASVPDTQPPEGIQLVPVTDADGVGMLVEVHDAVFGGDHRGLGDDLLARLRVTDDMVAPVLALADGKPVSAARVDFHLGTDFASLWGGGTLPEWRGKGIYRATVSFRARLAAERGFRYLRTDALPTSRPILERLGFHQLTTTVPYVSAPSTG